MDEHAQTVTCPNGNTRPIVGKKRTATFGVVCRGCPFRARCTTSRTGRKVTLHKRDALLRNARRDWNRDRQLREKYRGTRPNVERVISRLANHGGRRVKLRYRGTGKNHAWLKTRTAGLNLAVLVGRGLSRTSGQWVLATA